MNTLELQMLWDLLVQASSILNSAVKAIYTIIDPTLLDHRKVTKQGLEEEGKIKRNWSQRVHDFTRLICEHNRKHAAEKRNFYPPSEDQCLRQRRRERSSNVPSNMFWPFQTTT
jgi:hypothetical protein